MTAQLIPTEQYALAGRATFTLKSRKTGAHLTYKIQKSVRGTQDCYYVRVLSEGYELIGVIDPHTKVFRHAPRASRFGLESVQVGGFAWWWNGTLHRKDLADKVEFIPSGRCAACNRKLTDPESHAIGVGPECGKKLGINLDTRAIAGMPPSR